MNATSPSTRAVVVVFDPSITDIQTAMIRNGLRMFRGVQQVLPVLDGVPTDAQARRMLAHDAVLRQLEDAERQLAERAL
jgi:hypothetical protein